MLKNFIENKFPLRAILLVVILVTSFAAVAQTNDRELAELYFNKEEYDKAALYYEKLYEENANTYYYQKLLTSYKQTERYDDAIKLIKKEIKKSQNPSLQHLDLGVVYQKKGENKKADKSFREVLDKLPASQGFINLLGRKFTDLGMYDWAEEVYEKGKALFDNSYSFSMELANLHGARGNTAEMIASYVELVELKPVYLSTVKNSLIRFLDFTDDEEMADLLRKSILKAVQNNPENAGLTDLLVWYYYQIKDFNGAFIQLRALDKKKLDDGTRLLDFARTASNNGANSAANKAYNYLIDNNRPVVENGLIYAEMAQSAYKALQDIPDYTTENIDDVQKQFSKALNHPVIKRTGQFLLLNYADFQLKYLQQKDSAKQTLQEVINSPSLFPNIIGIAKLNLGDILLIENDIWEAALLYGQVDKAFKNDVLGGDAKFRNSKIAYYTGDFEWAQAQLDILKRSTSKLISNDALQLSLLISDNLNMDTTAVPLYMYAQAELLTFQNRLEEAKAKLDSISLLFPLHGLADEILFEEYQVAYKQKRFDVCKLKLEAIISGYSYDLFGDNATYELALLLENQLQQPQEAVKLYEKLLTDYPGSLFVVEARKRLRTLRGDKIN